MYRITWITAQFLMMASLTIMNKKNTTWYGVKQTRNTMAHSATMRKAFFFSAVFCKGILDSCSEDFVFQVQ